MLKYLNQKKLFLAVDCIIFGFDNKKLNVLLVKRGFEPHKGKWSLMGGFVQPNETPDESASRVLKNLTGLENIYLEQFGVFGDIKRELMERTVSLTYFALIDSNKYERMINDGDFHAEWFPVNKVPQLIFDHNEMVDLAIRKLRFKASVQPILFELLPEEFTLSKLRTLYNSVYGTKTDGPNFNRKILSTGLLLKQKKKEKLNSKKGAFYYKLNNRKYNSIIKSFSGNIPRLF